VKKISIIFGTRPEAIKLWPLIFAMKDHQDFEPHVCVTAQHREMLDQMLEVFGIVPDVDLSIMKPNQALSSLTSRLITAIDGYLAEYKPDMVMVQGDTTTTFSAALAAFYNKIPVGHVEAGLRTKKKYSPYPEEINRVLTSHIADYHFAPTKLSKENLLREGISEDKIFITGNTGEGFKSICNAIVILAKKFPEVEFIYPIHFNPNVRKPVFDLLSGHGNIYLIEPLSYLPFVYLMDRSSLILTDSGGIQEEAPSLGKPVIVMRKTTERPEAVEMGTVKLVGTDVEKIVENVSTLLTDEAAYAIMANAINPYGDGKAAGRILTSCEKFLDG